MPLWNIFCDIETLAQSREHDTSHTQNHTQHRNSNTNSQVDQNSSAFLVMVYQVRISQEKYV